MSKRDDEPSDMDAGMTTAERRRRRRRGGGLRVPSDNVPRTSRAATAPPVVAPVPEDPALAMSIAYSFTNDGSQPVARVDLEPPAASKPPASDADNGATVIAPPINGDGESVLDGSDVMDGDESTQFAPPIAPEGSPTVIDPPAAPPEAQEFEMKTREMSAVDLEALGLSELAPKSSGNMALAAIRAGTAMASPPPPPAITPAAAAADPDVQVRFKQPTTQTAKQTAQALAAAPKPPELAAANAPPKATTLAPLPDTIDTPTSMAAQPDPDGGTTLDTLTPDPDAPAPVGGEASGDYVRPRRERVKTVALNDDDLEEVREVVRAMSQSSQVPIARQPRAATQPPMTLPTGVPVGHGNATSIPDGTGSAATSQSIEIQVLRDQAADEPAAAAPTTKAPPGKTSDEILSVPDIDIQMLSEQSGANAAVSDSIDAVDSIEVDVDDVQRPDGEPAAAVSSIPPAIARATTAPVIDTSGRGRAPSVPPPFKDTTAPVAKVDGGTTPPPTPAPVAHKAPPAPPPAAAKTKPAPSTPPPPAKPDKSRGKPWFVDLFDEDYLRTLPFLTPQATQAEAEFVIDAMGLQPGAQVLDLGCGYGRHAMELAARGFHMVGLDISTPLLVRGGEEAHRRGLTINFVRGDMRELDFDSQFDGAYCLFSTFGYFDDETNKKTVSNIARALKPGGRVMIEILNRDYVIADLPTRIWWEGEGCVVLEEVELNYFSSRIQVNRSVVFDDGRQLEQEISVRAYSLHEVGKLMHAAGFRVLEVSGGYQTRGRFFGNQSRHIIVLAERKDTA